MRGVKTDPIRSADEEEITPLLVAQMVDVVYRDLICTDNKGRQPDDYQETPSENENEEYDDDEELDKLLSRLSLTESRLDGITISLIVLENGWNNKHTEQAKMNDILIKKNQGFRIQIDECARREMRSGRALP